MVRITWPRAAFETPASVRQIEPSTERNSTASVK
jgi:hypothetical protein